MPNPKDTKPEAATKPSKGIDWSEYEGLMGKVPDTEIAKSAGCNKSSVTRQRKLRGIAACKETKTKKRTRITARSGVPATTKGPNKKKGETGPNVKPTRRFDGPTSQKYLEALAITGAKANSAEVAGVSRQCVRLARESNEAFAAMEMEALEVFRENIELAIRKRGIDGVPEPVFFQGRECGEIQKYSDSLLALYAKRHIAEYRDKPSVDVSIGAGVLVVGGRALSDAEYDESHGG